MTNPLHSPNGAAKFDKLFRPTGSPAMRKIGELRTELAKAAYGVAENKRAAGAFDAKLADVRARLDRLEKRKAELARPEARGADAGDNLDAVLQRLTKELN